MSLKLNKMPIFFSNFVIVMIKLCRASDCSEPVHSISHPHISLFPVISHIIIFYIIPNILNGHFSTDFLPKILSPASVFFFI